MRGKARIFFVIGACLLAGCSIAAERDEQALAIEDARSRRTVSSGDRAVDRLLRSDADDGGALETKLKDAPSLDLVRDAVARRNPNVEVALERWVSFLERVPQRLAPPNPMVEYRYSSMFKMHEAGVVFGLPFPTKLLTEARAALAESRMARAEYSEQINQLRAQAAQAFAAFYLSQRELDVLDRNIAILARLAEAARAHQAVGKGTLADVLKVEVELEGLKADREAALGNLKTAASALNVLLDRRPEAPLGRAASLPEPAAPEDVARLLELAIETRPELLATKEKVAAADEMVSRADQEWIPDLQLGGSYVRDFGMDHNFGEAMGGISLPIWIGAIRGRIREAEAQARGSRAELRAARNRVLDEVASSAAQVQAAAERHRILATVVVPRAEEAFKSAESSYTANMTDFLALLDAQRSLLAKELERERALTEHAMRRADLERAIGLGAEPTKERGP